MSNELDSWDALNKALKKIKEDPAWELLKEEQAGRKRPQFLLRIYGRANLLRSQRERKALMKSC
jgi:hypothetical protein